MTIILLICSVALNVVLFFGAVAIWNRYKELANSTDNLMMDLKRLREWRSATSESPSTPGTSTESPTPAPDAD